MAVGANFRDEHVRRSVTTSQNCTSKHQDISYALAAVATTVRYIYRQATHSFILPQKCNMIRYDTRCYFNVHSKADKSQLNLPHKNNN